MKLVLLASFVTVLGVACGDADVATVAGDQQQTLETGEQDTTETTTTVAVQFRATYIADADADAKFFALAGNCPTETADEDSPDYGAGADCDGDGGVVNLLTPSRFYIAFKSVYFVHSDNTRFAILPDVATLAESTVLDLKTPYGLDTTTLASGEYASVEAVVYYYEIVLPINVPEIQQRLRIYLSDDDFADEGDLGHHQGDIVMVDNDGQELGWVGTATQWTVDNLQVDRGSIEGAGGVDSETGHRRGLFGSSDFWNQSELQQGSQQDHFVLAGPLDLTVADQAKTVVFDFDIVDSWYFEDFDDNGKFNPCDNTQDACAIVASWAPLFRAPSITVK